MMKKRKYQEKKSKVRILCGLFLVWLWLCFLSGCRTHDKALVYSWQEGTENAEMAEENETGDGTEAEKMDPKSVSHEESSTIYVHVCGAVVSPGVVELKQDARVEDALLAAGGFREEADKDYVNLASKIEDGQQLYFPSKEEVIQLQQEQRAAESSLININTAGLEALCTLPGIGEARARDIVAYREANGGFESIEDIMQVSGIKQSAFEKLKDKIIVN